MSREDVIWLIIFLALGSLFFFGFARALGAG